MAYQVNKFNGAFLVTVDDGTIDTTTDLRFVGKNYAGYGEIQNENFLHLLESFANTTAPPRVVPGQIWFDTASKKLKFYDGSRFKVASGAEVSKTAPSGLAKGDFWFDENANQLYAWTGTEFILVGPQAAPEFGTSAAVGQVVQDSTGSPKTIVKMVSGGDTVAIVSKEEFILGSVNPITGFSRIKKGITLINTDATSGITSTASQHYFWGTASNALKLGGVSADQFLTKGSISFDTQIKFKDAGFVLGDNNDLYVFHETQDPFYQDITGDPLRDDDQTVFYQNSVNQPITIRMKINDVERQNVLKIKPAGIFPGITGVTVLGDATKSFLSVTAATFIGNLTGNVTGNVTGIHNGNIKAADASTAFDASTKIFYGQLGTTGQRSLVYGDLVGEVTGSATSATRLGTYSPSIITGGETVAVRDAGGNLSATAFLGTASTANRLKIDNLATDTDPNYKSAKTTATADTIAARDGSGNLVAVLFDGTATAARYADLAEKYLADKEYAPGTVVAVGGEAEVTAASYGDRAIGVVSTNPAFMMNKDLEGGTYVALKGRVPVRVLGAVRKGQRLVAAQGGTAAPAVPHANDVFAIALESNDNVEEKLVEAVIL